MCSYLCLAPKPLVYSVQDGVLHDVLVELFSRTDRCQLGDHRRQTQGGVVRQRHVTNLHQRREGERREEISKTDNEKSSQDVALSISASCICLPHRCGSSCV